MSNSSTKKFAFVLGRERELCLAELKAVLKRFCFDFDPSDSAGQPASLRAGILSVADNIVYINIDLSPENVKILSGTLGGTVKIYQIIRETPDDLKSAMAAYIEGNFKDRGKVAFGLSVYQPERLNLTHRMVNNIGFQVKKELRNLSVSSRFIELKEGTEVPSILSLKENLIGKGVEFGLFPGGFGVLTGLSNPEEWSKRDYNKPAGDKYSGMLPPKLARIMINLALGQDCRQSAVSSQQNPTNYLPTTNCLVVDPFCGSGNILMEALMLGCGAFGSDISEKAVSDSQANLDWLAAKYHLINANYSLTQADATAANLPDLLTPGYRLPAATIRQLTIVTEPFLGEPKKFKPTLNAVRGEYGKIKEIYLRFLKNFAKADLPSGTVFCVVFPLVETLEEKRFSLFRECVDEIGKIGYTKIQSPLIYGRDYQVVKREILLLTLN